MNVNGSIKGASVIVYAFSEHLNNVTKVFPLDVVVRFDEDLSQDGLADGIVFGIELVKAMESVTVLQRKSWNTVSQSLIY